MAWQYSVHVVIYQVDWGEASMIEAERRLLKHALDDPYNERFVFLSDRWQLIFIITGWVYALHFSVFELELSNCDYLDALLCMHLIG